MLNTSRPDPDSTPARAGTRQGPLSGFRVLTVDNYFAGNYGPMLLALHGAEVVKIEQPGTGDPLRTDAPFLDVKQKRLSHGELRLMRNKASVAIQLRSDAGRALLGRLAKEADVFWTNLRPGAAKRLGVEPEAVKAMNPNLIYASLSGFGLPGEVPGPFSEEPAFDIIVQALAGLMSRNADAEGVPTYSGLAIGDSVTSLYTAFGVVMALLSRERGGKPATVDVAMFDSMLALNEKSFTLHSMTDVVPPPRLSANNAPFGPYPATDGNVIIGVGGNPIWQRFCKAIGRDDLGQRSDLDTGVKRAALERSVIRPAIENWLSTRTIREASKILQDAGVPASAILEIDSEVMREQARMRGLVADLQVPGLKKIEVVQSPVRLSTQPLEAPEIPHALGDDTDAILRAWLGMDDAELARLRKEGTIA